MRTLLRVVFVPLIVGAIVMGILYWFMGGKGFSTRDEPSWFETRVAQQFRAMAMPGEARDRQNPVKASPEVLEEGLAHFADHCAACHGNDGSGDTPLGKNMYPRAPDMRAEDTQKLTDGELFYIIENGVRLTGMPAWGSGTPEGERASWHLVHFIRRLPKLTPEEIARMKDLNPKTPAEWREEQQAREFLDGRDGSAAAKKPAAAPPHKHE